MSDNIPKEQQNNPNEDEHIPEIELSQETPIKRIFNYERVDKSKKYYLNQSPPKGSNQKYMDEIKVKKVQV